MFVRAPPFEALSRSTIKQVDVVIERVPGTDIAVAYDKEGNPIIASKDHAEVINKAISYLPPRLSKIVINGDLIIRKRVTLRSDLVIENNGRIIGDLLDTILYGNNVENVFIVGKGWIRQSKVNIYGQANGYFNSTYPCIVVEGGRNIVIYHEVGGFPTTSQTDSRPKGPAWSIQLKQCSRVSIDVRGDYALEHVLVQDSRDVMIRAVVEKSFDSSICVLRSDNVVVNAVIDLTDVPCCANGLEINTSRNVRADVVVHNPPVHGVWLYYDSSAGQDMYNIDVRASVYGGKNGIYGVEGGNTTNVYNISINARVYNVSGNGIDIGTASNISLDAIVKNAGNHSLEYYKINDARIRLISISPGVHDLHDHARDTGEGLVSSNVRLIDFYSDKYSFNVYPEVYTKLPYTYTLFLKDYSVAAGSTVDILSLKSRTNSYFAVIRLVKLTNSYIYVQLYNVDAAVVAEQDNTSGVKNWGVWWTYNYAIRLYNSDSVNAQTTDLLIEIQSVKPIE